VLNRVHLHTKPTQICNLLETTITTFSVCLARLLFRQFQVLATESHHKGVQHAFLQSEDSGSRNDEAGEWFSTVLVSDFKFRSVLSCCWLVTGFCIENTCYLYPNKVRTDSSTEFEWNSIVIDGIRIKSMDGSNLILIVKIRTALDRTVDLNKRVNAFTTSMAYTTSSDIKGGKANIQPRCEPVHNRSITSHPLFYNYMA